MSFREAAGPPEDSDVLRNSRVFRRTCCLPEAHTYKSIVLLSLIICLRKGYAFEHLEQFHLHALLRRALRKVRGNKFQQKSGQADACTDSSWNSLIKEIIIDKKKLHLYNKYTEVSYES